LLDDVIIEVAAASFLTDYIVEHERIECGQKRNDSSSVPKVNQRKRIPYGSNWQDGSYETSRIGNGAYSIPEAEKT
jgi:hypothetical protein